MISTARLDLVPMTRALVAAEREGVESLARGLGVAVPDTWPPDLFDADDLDRLDTVLADPANAGWATWYVVRREPTRAVVGVAGFGGGPKSGVVDLGYSVLMSHRRQGYASEAVAALVAQAFRDDRVQRVAAETYPGMEPSIRTLERTGFVAVPVAADQATIRFERTRATVPATVAADAGAGAPSPASPNWGMPVVYCLLLIGADSHRGSFWGYLWQALYLAIFALAMYSTFSPSELADEQKRRPDTTRLSHYLTLGVPYVLFPAIAWIAVIPFGWKAGVVLPAAPWVLLLVVGLVVVALPKKG